MTNRDCLMQRFVDSGPQWAQSESGFVVRFAGRYKLEYIESGCTLEVSVEHLANPFVVAIFLSEVKRWARPHSDEPLPPERVQEIGMNIAAAMKHLRTPFELK